MQLDLIDALNTYPCRAGWKRRATSREAAATVDANQSRKEQCYADILYALTLKHLVIKEFIALFPQYELLYARPRFSELVAAGLIEEASPDERRNRQAAWRLA